MRRRQRSARFAIAWDKFVAAQLGTTPCKLRTLARGARGTRKESRLGLTGCSFDAEVAQCGLPV